MSNDVEADVRPATDGPLFFEVVSRSAIWGGTSVSDYFGYDVPEGTGQVWAFAAQPDGDTRCVNGAFAGATLGELWEQHPELFQSRFETFPFIISLVAPEDDLSIQVHPDEAVARELGYPRGKNEAWVILDAAADSGLVYGLTCSTERALERIRHGQFEGLFRRVPTHAGEFFYIPAGTVHALGRGNVTYEVQQATNLTFRIFDYGRTDEAGRPRPLDTGLAMRCVEEADRALNETLDAMRPAPRFCSFEDAAVTQYVSNGAFTIGAIASDGHSTLPCKGYWVCTVAQGEGRVNGVPVRFADNFLLPATCGEVRLEGAFTLMVTSESSIIP